MQRVQLAKRNFEIGRVLHLKFEIRNRRLDRPEYVSSVFRRRSSNAVDDEHIQRSSVPFQLEAEFC